MSFTQALKLKSLQQFATRHASALSHLLMFAYVLASAMLLGHKDAGILLAFLFFVITAKYRVIFNSSVIATTIFAVVLSPCMVYGKINSDFFLNALVADKVSALEFISTLPAKLFVSVAFVLISAWALIGFRRHLLVKEQAFRALSIVFLCGFMLSWPLELYVNNHFRDKDEAFHLTDIFSKNRLFMLRDAINIPIAYKAALAELEKQAQVLNAKPEWTPKVTHTGIDNYVVVIGESVRRDALNTYGFEIENTPFLSATPKIQFNHYISDGGNTVTSLTNMLMLNYRIDNRAGNNIVDLANLAGFETYWLSDQHEVGAFDSIVGGIGKKARHHHFLSVTGTKNVNYDDHLLIPHVAASLNDESTSRKIIFVHLYGSHSSFCKRVDGEYETPYINRDLSCYVQSIKQTDGLLNEIHSLLQQEKERKNREWAIVYFSDHGLSASETDETIRHGEKYKSNYDVPFIVMNSTLTETTYINAQRSALNFFDFFSNWTGIKDHILPNECNFISEDPCPHSHTVVRYSDKQEMDYFKLGDERVNYFRS